MALQYPSQSKLETLARKAPGATPNGFPARWSDTQGVVFGGRGQRADELAYLRGQNASVAGVDTKDSDAWNKFSTGKGVVGSRSDQEQREFYIEKSFT